MAGEHIVIAEDDEGSRLLLSAFLEQGGYEVRVASNGLQALQLVRERLPNMVITDVNMPDVNGLEVAEAALKVPQPARVVLMSGSLGGREESTARTLGISILRKPFTARDVEWLVRGAS